MSASDSLAHVPRASGLSGFGLRASVLSAFALVGLAFDWPWLESIWIAICIIWLESLCWSRYDIGGIHGEVVADVGGARGEIAGGSRSTPRRPGIANADGSSGGGPRLDTSLDRVLPRTGTVRMPAVSAVPTSPVGGLPHNDRSGSWNSQSILPTEIQVAFFVMDLVASIKHSRADHIHRSQSQVWRLMRC